MNMNRIRNTLLIMLAAAGLSGVASAAEPMGGPGAPDHAAVPAQGEHRPGADRGERMARHQAMLHDKLKLTATQEAAWKTYVAAVTPPQGQRLERIDWDKLSAPERLERMLAMSREREAQMSHHLAAMKTFYATLTPLQQQIFNDNVGGGAMMRHHHRH
jgi:Spy/CpxP family protein refolding chaperone